MISRRQVSCACVRLFSTVDTPFFEILLVPAEVIGRLISFIDTCGVALDVGIYISGKSSWIDTLKPLITSAKHARTTLKGKAFEE